MMLHRSQRLLVQTLSQSFCSTGGKKPWNKKKKSQPQRTPKQAVQTHQRDDKRMNWADIHLEEGMKGRHEQKIVAKDKYLNLIQNEQMDKQLIHHVEQINKELSQNMLQEYMKFYFQDQFDQALSFTAKNIIGTHPDAEHAKHTLNRIFQKAIEGLVIRRDQERLDSFLTELAKHYEGEKKGCLQYNMPEMLDSFTIITEWQVPKNQQALKYSILNKFIRVARLKPGNTTQLKARLTLFLRKNIDNIISLHRSNNLSPETAENFEKFFLYTVEAQMWKPTYYKSSHFFSIVEALYFNKVRTNNRLYKNFFRLFSYINKRFDESAQQKFFKKFMRKLLAAKLSTTDTKTTPLPINKVFLQYYEKSFETQNVEIALLCNAIALSNNYLEIPAHFLQYQKQAFPSLSKKHIEIISNQYHLRELSLAYNGQKQIGQDILEEFKQKLSQKQTHVLNLKKAIVTKQFESAMQIFNENFFNEVCLKKERQKIKYVLSKLLLEQFEKIKNKRRMYAIKDQINKFVGSLSDEYLIESWKKSEDFGYLLEDFYIIQKYDQYDGQQEFYQEDAQVDENQEEEGSAQVQAGEEQVGEVQEDTENVIVESEETSISKQQKRHQFWSNYFKLKRAVDISRFQYIDGLKSIKQSEKQPALPGQFNLNQYLSEENFDTYRDLEYYGNKKQTELDIFLYRAEVAIDDCEIVGLEKSAQRLLERQNNLCLQNLKILEDFGLKDYDISLYDHQEYLDRIETLRNFRGMLKNETISKSPFIPQETFSSLIEEEEKDQEELEYQAEAVDQIQGGEAEQAEVQAVEQAPQTEEVVQEVGEEAQQEIAVQEAQVKIPIRDRHVCDVTAKEVYFDEESEQFKKINTKIIDIARVKDRRLFEHAEMTVRLQHNSFVQELLEFGLQYRQPMAIYMAQKLAMQTNQMIPHFLAIRVSDFLSHSREEDENLQKLSCQCKRCLSLIGPIRREMIYDSNKIYQHISHKPYFQGMATLYNQEIKERLADLVAINHIQPWENSEPRENLKRLTKNYLY